MSESLHEMAIRMRNEKCRCDCTDCEQKDKPCFIGTLCRVDNADYQIETLKKWASEYPRNTWLDLLRKKLPDSVYAKDYGRRPTQCPHTLLGGKAPGVNNRCRKNSMIDISCWECWDSEVEE